MQWSERPLHRKCAFAIKTRIYRWLNFVVPQNETSLMFSDIFNPLIWWTRGEGSVWWLHESHFRMHWSFWNICDDVTLRLRWSFLLNKYSRFFLENASFVFSVTQRTFTLKIYPGFCRQPTYNCFIHFIQSFQEHKISEKALERASRK